MTITGDLWRVTFSGSLGSTERFAHGMYISAPTGAIGTTVCGLGETFLTAVLGAAAASLSPAVISTAFHSIVHWDTIHAGPIDRLTGKQSSPGTTVPTNHTGGGSGNALPYQASHCVTVLASTNPGLKRRRNRFYLPPYAQAVLSTSTSKYNSAYVGQLAAAIATGQTAMAASGPGTAIVVYSFADKDAFDAVETYVGDVVDTQRRRRRSIPEVRSIVAL